MIPIIENTAWEHELADSLGDAIRNNPKSCAVLVRRHGMYVWGDTWQQAKRHGECLHYLFEIAINLKRLGVQNLCAPPIVQAMRKRLRDPESFNNVVGYKYIIFDVEGTTTPISFVKDVLFPFAADSIEQFLTDHWNDAAIHQDIVDMCTAAGSNVESMSPYTLARYAKDLIRLDSKMSPLKNIQGHIWELAYSSGKLFGKLFDDVPHAFQRLHALGVRLAIYSSGSRRAQYLLFKHSEKGDLSPYISCYFDTSIGSKRSSSSYENILLSIGQVASDVLFVTDVVEEADSAASVGMNVRLSVRPGNAELQPNVHHQQITSFDQI